MFVSLHVSIPSENNKKIICKCNPIVNLVYTIIWVCIFFLNHFQSHHFSLASSFDQQSHASDASYRVWFHCHRVHCVDYSFFIPLPSNKVDYTSNHASISECWVDAICIDHMRSMHFFFSLFMLEKWCENLQTFIYLFPIWCTWMHLPTSPMNFPSMRKTHTHTNTKNQWKMLNHAKMIAGKLKAIHPKQIHNYFSWLVDKDTYEQINKNARIECWIPQGFRFDWGFSLICAALLLLFEWNSQFKKMKKRNCFFFPPNATMTTVCQHPDALMALVQQHKRQSQNSPRF